MRIIQKWWTFQPFILVIRPSDIYSSQRYVRRIIHSRTIFPSCLVDITLFHTLCFVFIQQMQSTESDQQNIRSILNTTNASEIVFIKRDKMRQAINSRRGMVITFIGATLVLAATNLFIIFPSRNNTLKYITAA